MVSASSSGRSAPIFFVELLDLGQRLHAPARAELAFLDRQDVVLFLVEVVLVLDVADDLLEHVLDGDQAGHAAVFVDHDGHVVVVRAEVAQQHVQALRFRDEDRRAQHVAHVEGFLGVVAQQVLGQQDADHLVALALDGGEARVRRFQHVRQPFSIGLEMSTTSICERGTMMSRTDRSETWNTPSIMERASASMRLRSWASCSTSSSSARFSGSGEISAVSRSNSDRWVLASVRTSAGCSGIVGVKPLLRWA
jgi:hypothetical protein